MQRTGVALKMQGEAGYHGGIGGGHPSLPSAWRWVRASRQVQVVPDNWKSDHLHYRG